MLRRMRRWSAVFVLVLGVVSVPGFAAGTETSQSIAHYIMGLAHEFEDRPEAAALEYQKTVLSDPAAFAAHMRLGIISAQLGNASHAIRAFTAASELQPDDLQVRYLLALSYSSIKDTRRAGQEFETLLKTFIAMEPNNVEFYLYLADLYYSQGKIAEAVAQFEKILGIQPDNTAAQLQVGASYLDGPKRSEGIALLQRCMTHDPLQDMCLNALGYAYAEDNIRLDEAEDLVMRALAIKPDNGAYFDTLGWVYARQGKLSQALDLLNKAVALEKHPEIFDHIGDVYEKMGVMDKALDAWRNALEMDQNMPAVKEKISRYKKGPGKK